MPTAGKTERRVSIAYYMHDFAGGGVERMRLALIPALVERGVAVSVIVHARSGSLTSAVPPGIPVVELGTRRTAADIPQLIRILRRRTYDAVLADLDHNNIALMVARILAGRGTLVVINQHNALRAEGVAGWKYRLVPLLYRLLWRSADAILAVSNGVADDLARSTGIPRAVITVIYNPVVGPEFAVRAAGPPPHDWLRGQTIPVFVFVGRLTAQKDPQVLLVAMSRLIGRSPFRLIILGEGELAEALADLAGKLGIAHAICFAGFQQNPLPWIRHASALVLTSRYEGLGNVIIEALACGTPVIATDCPFGPAEILQGGRLGSLVPVGDATAIARAMQSYDCQTTTAHARQCRAADFTVGACVDRHMALFGRLLGDRPLRQCRVFGLSLSALDAGRVAAHVLAPCTGRELHLLATPNINHLRLLRNAEFAEAYARASLVCADGFPVVLYARLRGVRISGRATGCDIFHHIAQSPALHAHRLFFIVESKVTAAAADAWAASRGLSDRTNVAVAAEDLGQDRRAQRDLADAVREHATTIMVVTLGAPVSEIFVQKNRDRLPGCWALCVGQALRVELGLVRRAPPRWQSLGLEWAWRLREEPGRLGTRYLKDALWFPVAVLRDLVDGR